jgi:hypothetical protein
MCLPELCEAPAPAAFPVGATGIVPCGPDGQRTPPSLFNLIQKVTATAFPSATDAYRADHGRTSSPEPQGVLYSSSEYQTWTPTRLGQVL